MKFSVDGKEYTVPAEEEILFLQQVKTLMLQQYDKLGPDIRFAAKPFARGYLQKLENEARVKYGKEQALVFRPEKKQDAVVHLSGIMVGVLREALQHVTISVGTVNNTVASFKIGFQGKSAAGGPMAADGYIGFGQDNSTEVS